MALVLLDESSLARVEVEATGPRSVIRWSCSLASSDADTARSRGGALGDRAVGEGELVLDGEDLLADGIGLPREV